MIRFPLIERLDVTGYGLYPGHSGSDAGLHVDFAAGLTLVIGANGLGKTTLVTLLYRMLAGPFDLRGLTGRAGLGNADLEVRALSRSERVIFADRVVDGAAAATANLTFRLGVQVVEVVRRLSDLTLTDFRVDGVSLGVREADDYQSQIRHLCGLSAFGDWILLLRHVVFYFEDRRALVWDTSAQRQILRLLFLPPDTALQWTKEAREVLELDSRMRNLRAVLNEEERSLAANESRAETGAAVDSEVRSLEQLQAIDEARREDLEGEFVELDARREQLRLRALKAEQERDSRLRELERAKLTAIGARFPNRSEVARYVLAQLLSEGVCLVCGNAASEAATEYEARIDRRECVVCESDLSNSDLLIPAADVADRRVDRAASGLAPVDVDMNSARRALDEAEQEYQLRIDEARRLNNSIAQRSARIDSLIKRLPPDEAVLHGQRSNLAAMRGHLGELQEKLVQKREAFRSLLESLTREVAAHSENVRRSFDEFAQEFLIGICHLVWSLQREQLGQGGPQIDFPAFEVEMTGTDYPSPVRRSGPEQVSESQREFIDLAFRMALVAVAGLDGVGTLVIDAPETSLDAVFETRAAAVLAEFAGPQRGNRLLITTNLVRGDFIPELVRRTGATGSEGLALVDLFQIAVPTAAVTELRSEYDRVRDEVFPKAVGQS